MNNIITKDKWIWMGHPAHFCGAKDCKFFLATKVGKYLVSTVGEYWPERQVREIHAKIFDSKWFEKNKHKLGDDLDNEYFKRFGYYEIGFKKTYETFVFYAKRKKPEKDESNCCPFIAKSWGEIDSLGYNDSKKAFQGHYKMCQKWSKL